MKTKTHFYEVNVKWDEGRQGFASSPDLNEAITCATPPEFPAGVPGIWSPEHFYTAAISSCYMTTFLAIAENSKLAFKDFTCKTTCKLEVVDGKFLITEALIEPEVVLENLERDRAKAERILQKSKEACLVTRSMKTESVLKPSVV